MSLRNCNHRPTASSDNPGCRWTALPSVWATDLTVRIKLVHSNKIVLYKLVILAIDVYRIRNRLDLKKEVPINSSDNNINNNGWIPIRHSVNRLQGRPAGKRCNFWVRHINPCDKHHAPDYTVPHHWTSLDGVGQNSRKFGQKSQNVSEISAHKHYGNTVFLELDLAYFQVTESLKSTVHQSSVVFHFRPTPTPYREFVLSMLLYSEFFQ